VLCHHQAHILGATKSGALAAQAVVFFKRELADNFIIRRFFGSRFCLRSFAPDFSKSQILKPET